MTNLKFEDKKNKTQETQEEKPVSEFEVNSNKKVADAANLGSKVIANSSNTYSSEAKRIAQEELNSLGKNEFEDEHELSEALTKKATNLETQDEEDNGDKSQAASLLRQAASKIEASTVAPISAEAVTTKQNIFSRTSENATRTANPNANAMDTLNIAYIKSKYPNGALAKYLDQYKVEDFLRSDFMSGNPPIMFISDPQLAQDIQQELKSKGWGSRIGMICTNDDKATPLFLWNGLLWCLAANRAAELFFEKLLNKRELPSLRCRRRSGRGIRHGHG